MATTPNYGWVMPDPTDFVTDLPADFEVFGDAVDADLAGLLGGTTGQVLVKNSGTDHDYDFATDPVSDIVTTAGDLIYGTAADTIARLGIGTANQVLAVNSGATAPEWVTPAAGGGMTVISSGSFPAATDTLVISSIPATFKNLQLVMRDFKLTSDGTYALRFNSISSVYYSSFTGDNSSTATQAQITFISTIDNRDTDAACVVNVYDYTSTTSNKVTDSLYIAGTSTGAPDFSSFIRIGAVRSTDAINSLTILGSNNFNGGTYILYGVA